MAANVFGGTALKAEETHKKKKTAYDNNDYNIKCSGNSKGFYSW